MLARQILFFKLDRVRFLDFVLPGGADPPVVLALVIGTILAGWIGWFTLGGVALIPVAAASCSAGTNIDVAVAGEAGLPGCCCT